MSKSSVIVNDGKTSAAFLLSGKPTVPFMGKLPTTEKRIADPSASTPRGRSYPIPSFFEYRSKAKEFDSL